MREMLMLSDREEVSCGLAQRLSYKEIAFIVGRDPSVISREVRRHGGSCGYRAAAAQEQAQAARGRPKRMAVERCPRLREVVAGLLRRGWSPASIAGRLPIDYAGDEACRVSHEAIYQWIYATPVSTLARELIALRTRRTARRGGRRRPPAPRISDPTYIDERPAAAGRAVPGHWEGDLVIGKGGKTAVATLVERTSRFLVLVPLHGRDSLTVGRGGHRRDLRAPRAHAGLADLGLRCGDGRPHHRDQGLDAGLLHPPPLPMGTRQQRERQPHPARVLPERSRHHRRPQISGHGGLRHQRPPS